MSYFINHLKRLICATGYSLEGLKATYRTEPAFRQELLLLAAGIIATLIFDFTAIERLFLIGSLMLVLVVELINSAIEAIVDRVSTDIHPLSKKSKDAASAAVFVAMINAAIIWLVIIVL